jgi:NAD(P)-dependent dehydrogenase (short-subunit alcohol dehydrogenase family)
MNLDQKNDIGLITGASSGIGPAYAADRAALLIVDPTNVDVRKEQRTNNN